MPGAQRMSRSGANHDGSGNRQGHRRIVVEGAIRDVAEIRERGFPAFSSAVVPAGPHKGFGGVIDGAVSVGNCPVHPGI